MKITKDLFYGRSYQILLLLISVVLIFFPLSYTFFAVSVFFYGIAGAGFELITLNKFYSKEKKFKKDNLKESMIYGLLWTHFNIGCIKKYGTKLYYFEKLGSLPTFFAYLIMTLYVAIALILYNNFSYYGFAIYLIPIITNSISFWKNNYIIYQK